MKRPEKELVETKVIANLLDQHEQEIPIKKFLKGIDTEDSSLFVIAEWNPSGCYELNIVQKITKPNKRYNEELRAYKQKRLKNLLKKKQELETKIKRYQQEE